MSAFLISKVHFPPLGFESAGGAPLPPRFRNLPNEAVKAITLLPRVNNFSIVTTDAYCQFC